MLSGAMDVKLDGQGRIIVPEYLQTFAELKKKIVITGLYSRLEIWDEDKWNIYKQQTETNSNDIGERMGELGI
ncbi:MAG: division/cell wall cluster transcriptional repressor MraZ [Candidatus Magasanikbacteria bacterium]|nr:division/cell wall cluster transcriptional repressor MraZ [Candidatus Magasanikbacteria bacterium]